MKYKIFNFARQLALMLLVIWTVVSLVTLLIEIVPGDPATVILGETATQEQIEKWKAERGYDRPLYWNAKAEGTEKATRTVLWERSISLFALDFGRSDSGRSVDIGHEPTSVPSGANSTTTSSRILAGAIPTVGST